MVIRLKSGGDQGFTLVEVLVALFIFSLISLGTMTALTTALRGQAQLKEATETIAQIETARALMKSDMANLILRNNRDAYGNQDLFLISGGLDSLLTFTRSGRENPGGLEKRGDIQRVSYVLENGDLIRRTLPVANPTTETRPTDIVLMGDIQKAEIEFLSLDKTFPQIFITPSDPQFNFDRFKLALTTERGDTLTQIFEINP